MGEYQTLISNGVNRNTDSCHLIVLADEHSAGELDMTSVRNRNLHTPSSSSISMLHLHTRSAI